MRGVLVPPRLRVIVLACALALAAGLPALATAAERPPFRGTVRALTPAERAAMTPSVWRPGCPVSLGQLRRVGLSYVDFSGVARRGALVVNASVASDVVTAFRALYRAGFPIRRMQPIERYGGDDFASIEADNTSSFNCRAATGSSNWSNHAYGYAIDINPIENPYVSGGRTSHPASVTYLTRSRVRPGMAIEGRALVRAFDSVGWGWGGRWSGGTRDLQHFSPNGR